jgi:anti-anti-sigma regulatory factor
MNTPKIDFEGSLRLEAGDGRVLLGRERMILTRQESWQVLRTLLYEQLGETIARGVLTQHGLRSGRADFEALVDEFAGEGADDRLRLGFRLQQWMGAARFELARVDRSGGGLVVEGSWRNSFEAEIHLAQFGPDDHPVCFGLSGYLSGWCSEALGKPVLAVETSCMGQGEARCEFKIREDAAWGSEADALRRVMHASPTSISSELERKTALIQEQEAAISELSTPVMEIWDDILVLLIVGVVDTTRSMDLMTNLLDRIVETQSRCVIIDVTGVEVVDTKTADYLLKVIRSANLLGSRCVLTGLSPAIAQTLVEIGADLTEVNTLRNIKDGLKDCLRFLRSQKLAKK